MPSALKPPSKQTLEGYLKRNDPIDSEHIFNQKFPPIPTCLYGKNGLPLEPTFAVSLLKNVKYYFFYGSNYFFLVLFENNVLNLFV